jgi:hypothetical protein
MTSPDSEFREQKDFSKCYVDKLAKLISFDHLMRIVESRGDIPVPNSIRKANRECQALHQDN